MQRILLAAMMAAAMAVTPAFAHSDKPKAGDTKESKDHKKGDHKDKGHGHDKKH